MNFHFDNEHLKHCCGIVIEDKYRRVGYAKDAMKLMIDVAFNDYNIDSLIDNIPYNRTGALKLFTKFGFIDIKKDYYMEKFDNNERVIVLELTKDNYNKLNNSID